MQEKAHENALFRLWRWLWPLAEDEDYVLVSNTTDTKQS